MLFIYLAFIAAVCFNKIQFSSIEEMRADLGLGANKHKLNSLVSIL